MDDFVKGVDIIFIIGGEVGIGVVVGTEDDTVAETDTGVVVGIGFIVLVLSHPIVIRMQKIKKKAKRFKDNNSSSITYCSPKVVS